MNDPEEEHNVANDPKFASILEDLRKELYSRVDPLAVNDAAQASQAALVKSAGGRDTVLSKGTFQGTPAPGEKAEYIQ